MIAQRKTLEAEKSLNKVIQLNPGFADAYINLGLLNLDALYVGSLIGIVSIFGSYTAKKIAWTEFVFMRKLMSFK